MSFSPPDDVNLFEAPRTEIGAGLVEPGMDPDAELIRRAHLGHEASVKSIGSLYYLVAVFAAIAAIVGFGMAAGLMGNGPNAENGRFFGVILGVVAFGMFFLTASLGYGLSHLQVWARWTVVALISLQLLNNLRQVALVAMANPEALSLPPVYLPVAFSFLISGYILFLLISTKGGVVFSRAYKDVIARTPYIKYKTSMLLKVFLVVVVGLIAFGVVGAIMSGRR